MFVQTQDWIVGYLFGKVGDKISRAHLQKADNIELTIVTVPKYWFPELKNASTSVLNTLSEDSCKLYADRLKELFHVYDTTQRVFDFKIEIGPEQQYMKFRISATLCKPREMTLAEIESALGYRIKVVSKK